MRGLRTLAKFIAASLCVVPMAACGDREKAPPAIQQSYEPPVVPLAKQDRMLLRAASPSHRVIPNQTGDNETTAQRPRGWGDVKARAEFLIDKQKRAMAVVYRSGLKEEIAAIDMAAGFHVPSDVRREATALGNIGIEDIEGFDRTSNARAKLFTVAVLKGSLDGLFSGYDWMFSSYCAGLADVRGDICLRWDALTAGKSAFGSVSAVTPR